MRERIAIVDGVRTPFCKAGGSMNKVSADDLGATALKEIIARTGVNPAEVDEVIFGNVGQPANAANIARVIALKAGMPQDIIASTVHRNCASGMESITAAANKILAGEAEMILAGGTESMSNYPLIYGAGMTRLFGNLAKAKTVGQKVAAVAEFRPDFLTPVIALTEGLTDPVCGLNMGQTAEVLAREFRIGRLAQDEYAVESHRKAAEAAKKGILAEEIVPVPVPPGYDKMQATDDGIRPGQNLEALGKLKPYFDRLNGTVTPGNACPITDGAGCVLVMSESKARELGHRPLGWLRSYAYAGLEPNRMGLGPVYATAKALKKAGLSMSDIGLVELNEAFAVQVLANLEAFASAEFGRKYLGLDQAVGAIDPAILNVNGGAIALGHPVGASGTRLVVTLLKEMRRRGIGRGLATLCVGGGQGAALILEAE